MIIFKDTLSFPNLSHIDNPDTKFEAIKSYVSFFFDDLYFSWISKHFFDLGKVMNVEKTLYLYDLTTPHPIDPNSDYDFIFSGIVEYYHK